MMKKRATETSRKEWKQLKSLSEAYQNCGVCSKRLVLTLCRHEEKEYYCVNHCPEHKWQSDYDWPTECACCGITYEHYLERVLRENKITFSRRGEKP
jgi:hypothetical protein